VRGGHTHIPQKTVLVQEKNHYADYLTRRTERERRTTVPRDRRRRGTGASRPAP
jgi:hypothetical protein